MKSLPSLKTHLTIFILSLSLHQAFAQRSVGIGTATPNGNAVLELVSPDNNQGFLVPRLTTSQRNAMIANLSENETGLLVFDSDVRIFYFWQGAQWQVIDTTVAFTAGSGIEISDGTISNTGDNDNNSTNEIQNLTLDGSTLSLPESANV